MIQLTRLNNQPLMVNSDLIKCVERVPDTVLTLVTGEKIIVRESTEEVLERVVAFRRAILTGLARNLTDPVNISPTMLSAPEEGSGST